MGTVQKVEVSSAQGTLSREYQLVCHRRTFRRYQLPRHCASQRIRLRLRLSMRRPVFSFPAVVPRILLTSQISLRPCPIVRTLTSLKRVLPLTPYFGSSFRLDQT